MGHLSLLKRGKHHAPRLQTIFAESSAEALAFEVLEECAFEDRIAREQHYIDTLNSCLNGNRVAHVNAKLGYKLTPEQKARQWTMDPEKQQAAAKKLVGRVIPQEEHIRRCIAQQNNPLAGKHRLGVKETPELTARRLAAVRAAKAAKPMIWITDGQNNQQWHAVGVPVPDGWRHGRTTPWNRQSHERDVHVGV